MTMDAILRVLLTLAILAAVHRGDGDIPGTVEDPSGPAYDSESIYDTIGEIFGEARELEIRMQGTDIVEIKWGSNAGDSDRDTIGVNSKNNDGDTQMTIEEVAVVVEHEAKHVTNAANAPGDPPFDPTTKGTSGAETHANMHFDSIVLALDDQARCDSVTPEECLALAMNLAVGGKWAARAGLDLPTPEEEEAQSYMNECCVF